jgi:hypothetical protein
MMHRQIALALVLVSGCTSSLSWHAGGSGGSTSSSPSTPPSLSSGSTSGGDSSSRGSSTGHRGDQASAWNKLMLKDIVIGTAFYKVPGFTCGPDPAARGFSSYRHTCVKFLDERCDGRPSKINHVSSASDIPNGRGCFMDEGNGGTYLDHNFVSPPLSAIAIVATDTSAPRVYEIRYTLARDTLTEDSKLGRALIAKYGRPTYVNAPAQLTWTIGDVQLNATCSGSEGPANEFCTLQVSDTALLDSERSIQKAMDDEQQRKNAPAPSL